MRYTHYWYETKKPKIIPAEAVKIIKTITDTAFENELIQKEFNDSHRPVVNETEIRFNGVGEYGHETFIYKPTFQKGDYKPDNRYFNCCKTAQKPYDDIVMKVLLVLAKYIKGFEIHSDGDFEEEWADARYYMEKEFGIHSQKSNQLKVD